MLLWKCAYVLRSVWLIFSRMSYDWNRPLSHRTFICSHRNQCHIIIAHRSNALTQHISHFFTHQPTYIHLYVHIKRKEMTMVQRWNAERITQAKEIIDFKRLPTKSVETEFYVMQKRFAKAPAYNAHFYILSCLVFFIWIAKWARMNEFRGQI